MTLERGDVLYVPKHWWHFVESEDTSLSVNVWIDAADDPKDRVTEALTRVLVTAFSERLAAEVSCEKRHGVDSSCCVRFDPKGVCGCGSGKVL